jgi:hypothetical protein
VDYLDGLSAELRPLLIRGDVGFGKEPVTREAERRRQPYLFKLRLTKGVKRDRAGNGRLRKGAINERLGRSLDLLNQAARSPHQGSPMPAFLDGFTRIQSIL